VSPLERAVIISQTSKHSSLQYMPEEGVSASVSNTPVPRPRPDVTMAASEYVVPDTSAVVRSDAGAISLEPFPGAQL